MLGTGLDVRPFASTSLAQAHADNSPLATLQRQLTRRRVVVAASIDRLTRDEEQLNNLGRLQLGGDYLDHEGPSRWVLGGLGRPVAI